MRSLSRVPNLWIALAMQVLEVGEIQREEKIGLALPCRDKVHVIIDGTATNTVGTGLVERISDFLCIEDDHGCTGDDLFPDQTSGKIRIHPEAKRPSRERGKGLAQRMNMNHHRIGPVQHRCAGRVVILTRQQSRDEHGGVAQHSHQRLSLAIRS